VWPKHGDPVPARRAIRAYQFSPMAHFWVDDVVDRENFFLSFREVSAGAAIFPFPLKRANICVLYFHKPQ